MVIEIRRAVTIAEELTIGRQHLVASRVLLMLYFLILLIVKECVYFVKNHELFTLGMYFSVYMLCFNNIY